jgi:oxygen-independent coproporphyrinogen-3 oxidase
MLCSGLSPTGRALFDIDRTRPLSLYLHIPFCNRKCSYCGFFSKAGCSEAAIDAFASKLVSEIDFISQSLGKPFCTVFIGGGNPGILGEKRLLAIAKACCRWGKPSEFTVEMNPENAGSWLEGPLEYITRLSIGVQSLDQKVLDILGRNSSALDTLRGIEESQRLKQRCGFSLNYDFICCVPGCRESSVQDLKKIRELARFEHLSLYSLMVEPKTVMGIRAEKGEFSPVGDDDQADELEMLWDLLESSGMEHYEVSNFAAGPDHECLHNKVYWNMGQYLGLGPGAASTLYSPYTRVECLSNVDQYINSPLFSGYRTEALGRIQQMEEWAIMGCRTRYGLGSDDCLARFGVRLPSFLEYPGFTYDGSFFRPGREGFLLADGAASYVLDALASSDADGEESRIGQN